MRDTLETLQKRLAQLQADSQEIANSVYVTTGLDATGRASVIAHMNQADYAIGFARVVVEHRIKEAAAKAAAAELDQVNGRA